MVDRRCNRGVGRILIDYNRKFQYYSPISNAAELALTLNWFSISFGRNAAKPAISNPSLAPARFNMKKPGLPSRSVSARGSSRIFENASPLSLEGDCFDCFSCASDTLSLANSSEPRKGKRLIFLGFRKNPSLFSIKKCSGTWQSGRKRQDRYSNDETQNRSP